MKSLYTILGVPVDASPQQIEQAYAGALEALTAETQIPAEDRQIRLVAVKEAYQTLANPISRQMYNQRLFAPAPTTAPAAAILSDASIDAPFWTTGKLLVIGAVIIAAIAYFSYDARERERMRIEHEKALALKALQLKEEEQNARLAADAARQERMNMQVDEASERRKRYEEEQFRRQVDAQVRQNALAEQRKIEQEKREAENEKRRREIELQREQQRRIYEIQRLERANYGR